MKQDAEDFEKVMEWARAASLLPKEASNDMKACYESVVGDMRDPDAGYWDILEALCDLFISSVSYHTENYGDIELTPGWHRFFTTRLCHFYYEVCIANNMEKAYPLCVDMLMDCNLYDVGKVMEKLL